MRKGHGSKKVPGVKLRPAAPTKSKKLDASSQHSVWAQSSTLNDVDSSEIVKSCKKPFIGVVICASGVSDKVNLFQQAVQLGAQTSSDLTDRVTHLICENPGSAKYNYCVKHGVPILQPAWISDAHGKWLSGESVDVPKSASVHRFPTFKTIRLCLTAIEDVQRRKQIRKQLEKNGGTFVETLGKDTEITHLLCGPDRGGSESEKGITTKMQFVMKANRVCPSKVHLVWEDWFWDCLEFKGILSEANYAASGPRPQRRIMREPSPLLAPIASSAEQNQQRATILSSASDANQDGEEIANVKRIPEASARLWESMLKRRGYEMKGGELARSPSKIRASNSVLAGDCQSSYTTPSSDRLKRGTLSGELSSRAESCLNAAFKRTKSFAAKAAEPEIFTTALQRVRPTPTTAFKQSSSLIASSSVPRSESNNIPEGEQNLFAGLTFRALGEANGPKLTEALELRGAIVVEDPEANVDLIIVRLLGGNTYYLNERDATRRAKYRTECWVEQCMFNERICASEEHPAFVPLRIPTPISGSDKLVIHISGLTASEKTPSVRLVKAIGATMTDQLSQRNTHLICPCGSGAKFNKAQEWQIPILNLQWLYATVNAGAIQEVTDYLVTSAAPTNETSKGGMMTDITNSEFVQGSSKGKASCKSSDRPQSSSVSSAAVPDSRAEAEPAFSDSWTASSLLSESAAEHPPTSSPMLSSRSQGTNPSTPSSRHKHATRDVAMPKAPALSSFTSPIKPKRSTANNSGRVASSVTPSPLKLPSENTRMNEQEGPTTSITPPTATTSTLSGESASVLKDAIASLLGKRPSSDDQEAESQSRAQAQRPPTRASKRSKPPRRTKSRQDGSARPFSRTTSIDALGLSRTGSAYPFDFATGSGGTGDPPSKLIESPADSNMPGAGHEMGNEADESMRVTYEDPSQKAEKRRLLSLISGDTMDADAEQETIPSYVEDVLVEKMPQDQKLPKPRSRRQGRNLVRRRSTKATEQC